MKTNLISELQQRSRSTFLNVAPHAQPLVLSLQRAISAAWSASGSVAALWGAADAAVSSRPAHAVPPNGVTPNPQAKFLGTDPIERPLEVNQIDRCRL